jgi:hypothetical protein
MDGTNYLNLLNDRQRQHDELQRFQLSAKAITNVPCRGASSRIFFMLSCGEGGSSFFAGRKIAGPE